MSQKLIMNLSDWIKAAALITQQKQEAATADTDQLSSMLLSQLAMDDSGPPVVHYGMHMPAATSTPRHAEVDTHCSQQEDTYQQIIPGIPQVSLYPTLTSLSSEERTLPEETQTLCDKVSKGLEKYLQDAEQCQALEVNYFNDNTTGQNEESNPKDAEQTIQFSKDNQIPLAQTFTTDTNVAKNLPESLKSDTGSTSRQHSSARTAVEEKRQQIKTSEDIKKDAEAQHLMKDTFKETTPAQSEQLHALPTSTDEVRMPTEKVGCILVTSHLKQFPEDYPLSSEKQVFLDIYHMLSLLDKYLYDYPKQHTHCMSSDNEYVTLIQYAIHLHMDLTTFRTLWAVLSILLNTQDGKCEYVKCLQEKYNNYYEDKSRRYMQKLERQSAELQNCMYDSVTHNFDRVSGLHDNGLTPSQMEDGHQTVEITAPENAIDDDVIDIMTIYPPWPTDTDDLNDIDQMTNYNSIKDIRDELCKDTPQKTEINKPYLDNIDAYNRGRQLITASLSNKLDLGQNSLPGAQQVRVAVKHTDPIAEFPEHLRQMSLGEEIENISQTIADGNVSLIP